MAVSSRRIASVLAIVAAVGLLVPSGAVPFPMDTPSDQVGNQVEVVPAPGDGGAFARMVGGELVVDISANSFHPDVGLNPNSDTRLGEVFLIRYTGSRHAEVWVSHEGEGLTFSVAGEPIESSSQAIALRSNETVAVDVTIRTTNTSSFEGANRLLIHTREYTDEDTTDYEYAVHDDPEPNDATPSTDENDSATTPAGGDTPGDSGGTTVTGGGDDGQDQSTTTAVERTSEIAIENERTALESLVSGGIGWPLGIVAALMLAVTGLLVERRRRY